MSRREAARVFGPSGETIGKICRFSLLPGYTRTKPVEKPKSDLLLPAIDTILEADQSAPATPSRRPGQGSSRPQGGDRLAQRSAIHLALQPQPVARSQFNFDAALATVPVLARRWLVRG